MNTKCNKSLSFTLRIIHNRIKSVLNKSFPKIENAPKTQLQAGIMGYLYHHQDVPVYQKHIEEEFAISRATATNTLQCMEKSGLITRMSMDKDARLKRIQMTEKARIHHSQIEKHMSVVDGKMVEGMSADEQKELMRLLHIVISNLNKLEKEEITC